eukprot:3443553-Alexandrium_andersonii.AAC.1
MAISCCHSSAPSVPHRSGVVMRLPCRTLPAMFTGVTRSARGATARRRGRTRALMFNSAPHVAV